MRTPIRGLRIDVRRPREAVSANVDRVPGCRQGRIPVSVCLSLRLGESRAVRCRGRAVLGLARTRFTHRAGLSGGFGHHGAGSIPLLGPIFDALGTSIGIPVPGTAHWWISPVVRQDHQRADGDLSVRATRGRRLVGPTSFRRSGLAQDRSSISSRPIDPSWARSRAVVSRSRRSPSMVATSPRWSCTRIRAVSAFRR